MVSWRSAFENMTLPMFVQLAEAWILHARVRVVEGEIVRCSFVSLDKGVGVYNLSVNKRVTLQFLEDQERTVKSYFKKMPTELVFVGQTVQLMKRMLAPGDMTDLKEAVSANVRHMEQRIQTDVNSVDYTWTVDAGNGCLYLLTEYRQMFAFACGESSFKVTAWSAMTKLDLSSWIEKNVDCVKKCAFVTSKSKKLVPLKSSITEHENVTMCVSTDHGDGHFLLTDIYNFGTRLITSWYKLVGSSSSGGVGSSSSSSGGVGSGGVGSSDNDQDKKQPRTPGVDDKQPRTPGDDNKQPRTPSVDDKQPRTPSVDDKQPRTPGVDNDQDQDVKRPRTASGDNDQDAKQPRTTRVDGDKQPHTTRVDGDHGVADPTMLAAIEVIMDAARKQVAAETVMATDDRASLIAELAVCKARLAKVTADRDKLKGIFGALSKFNKNKK